MWPFRKKNKVTESTINKIMEQAEAEGFNELGTKTLKTLLDKTDLVDENGLDDVFKAIEVVVRDEVNSIIEHDRAVQKLDAGFQELKETVEQWGSEMGESEEAMENEIKYDEIACKALGITRTEYEVFMRIQCVCPDRRADGFCRKKRGVEYTDEVCHIQCPRVSDIMKEMHSSA